MVSVASDTRDRIAGRRVIASVSGGKDSAAMSLHLTELGIEHDRVFMDTGWEHALTYEYLRGPLTAKLGPILEIRGEMGFAELALHKGIFPSRVRRFCTEELKVNPMRRHVAALIDAGEDVLNVVGIRRAESKARSMMLEWEFDSLFDCEVWRPLVGWSEADVRAIHARHGLELNPLYAMGASRVGCWPCIHSRKSEIKLISEIDPERIIAIDQLEQKLDAIAAEKAAALGEQVKWKRSFFSYGGGGRKHVPLPILQAVEWSKSKRGEWQPPNAGEGCMKRGVCDTGDDK